MNSGPEIDSLNLQYYIRRSILSLLILITSISFSQVYTVSEKEIEVTTHFYNSFLLEMNSGNTVLLQIEPRIEGFLLKVYDEQHEQRVFSELKSESIKNINAVRVSALLELNKKAVIFYTSLKERIVRFNKLTIDPFTGEAINEIIHSYDQMDENPVFYDRICFFKIIENYKHDKYSLIIGYKQKDEDNDYKLIVKTFNTITNQKISEYSAIFEDHFQLELLDAIVSNEYIYLCLNRKFKPKDSETKGWFVTTQINYIPQNKVFLLKLNTNKISSKEILDFDLNPFIFSTKAQFSLDLKRNSINLLMSTINPLDSYGKIPDVSNVFYKISNDELTIKLRRDIDNKLALNKAASLYPNMLLDKNTFANFPQYMYTDTAGNNTFLFQTVYNHYNQPNSYSDIFKREYAFLYCDSETEINSITFSPYSNTMIGGLSGRLNYFSFNNAMPSLMPPRLSPYDDNYCQYKFFQIDDKFVSVFNLHPKNIGKDMNENFIINRAGEVMATMVQLTNKNYYSSERILNDEAYSKLKLNLNISSFNQKTRLFSALATEIKGKKERLVWIKFN